MAMAKFTWAILVAVIFWLTVMVGAGAVKDPAAEQPTGAPVEETKPTGGYAGSRGRPFFYSPLDEQNEMPFPQSDQEIGSAAARPSYWADGYGGYPGYGGSGGYGGQPGYGAGPGYGGGAGGGYGGGYGGGGQPYGGYGGGGSCYFNFGRCL